nr:MAG TPA: hypothetical protein [Caudoviricetes sp.]
MSFYEDSKNFKVWVERCNGNVYRAVYELGQSAAKRVKDCNNKISNSEAISWVLNGDKPDYEHRRAYWDTKKAIIEQYIDTNLELVDDKQIRKCVRSSVWDSLNHRYLLYDYKGVDDEPRRARIRILTKLIWYEIKPNYREDANDA